MPDLKLTLLGSFSSALDHKPLQAFRTKAVQALLIYLVCQPEEIHRREHLMTLLWPGLPQKSAQANLRQTIYLLRQAIPEIQAKDGNDSVPFLITGRQTIRVNPEATFELDVSAFETLLAGPIEGWSDAVALYRGDFLADFYLPDSAPFEEWVLARREALRRRVLQALEKLASRALDAADYDEAEEYSRRQIEIDELRESAHQQLMTSLAMSGRRTEALANYEKLRQLLDNELGAEPSAETINLYERILSDEREEPTRSESITASRSRHIAVKLPAFLENAEVEREKPVFVGREVELARLHEEFDLALEGDGRLLFIIGDPGSGKSSLLSAFAREASTRQPDLLVAWGVCSAFTGQGDPYLPFRHLLTTLTGDIEAGWAAGNLTGQQARVLWDAMSASVDILLDDGPDLLNTFVPGPALVSRFSAALPTNDGLITNLQQQLAKDQAVPGEMEQPQLFEQVIAFLRHLSEQQPILLLLDDLQWADQASLNLLFQFGRQLAGSHLLLVAAYRPEEVALGRGGERHPLQKVTAEFQRTYGPVFLDLGEVEADKKRAFVDSYLDMELNALGEAFRKQLYDHTGGHPLFTVETLRYLQDRGDLVLDQSLGWIEGPELVWDQLPDRVEGIIGERIGRLGDELREILSVAAVEGEEFTAQVVAKIQLLPERKTLSLLARDLEKRHRLVREREVQQLNGQQISRYQFNHALFQQFLYSELGEAERRLLHGEIGAALEELYKDQTNEIPIVLAHHYVAAGDGEKALPYLQQAGDQARILYAYKEAIDNYQKALDYMQEKGELDQAARMLMKLGLTHHNAFQFVEAQHSYEKGFALWQQAGSYKPSEEPPPAPHPLRLRLVEPTTIDPSLIVDLYTEALIDQLFSGLVEISPEMDVVPDVAQSWQVLDGGRRYLFKLRDDVTWSDGVKVTAADFEIAWKRVLDPTIESPNALLLYDIKGARAFHRGETADPGTVGVRSLDDLTLEVELEQPASYFLQNVAYGLAKPLPRHALQAHGPAWSDVDKIITNGPFQLRAWKPGQSIDLERYPNYHGRFSGNIETINLQFLTAALETANLYVENQVDFLDLPYYKTADAHRLRQSHADEYFTHSRLMTFYLSFDHRRPPFDNPKVRRAFALAIDKERLADVIFGGFHFPANGGFVPPGMPGHTERIGLAYDPEEGRRLLAESGYPAGRGFPDIKTFSGPLQGDMITYFRGQWLENLGIEVDWQDLSWNAFLGRLDPLSAQMWVIGWSAAYPDPDDFLRVSVWRHRTGWQNEGYERLIEEAQSLMDQGQRLQLYQQAERILIEQAAIVPLFYGRRHYLLKPWVRRFPSSGLKNWYWKDVIIDPH